MRKLLLIAFLVSLAGCSTIKDLIPSKWDDNQARVVTDIRQETIRFDCTGDQKAQLQVIARSVEWFDLYAQSKGTGDVAKLNSVFATTVKEYQDRINAGPVSPMYCDLKKKIMMQQAEIMAKAVQGRF